MLHFWLSLIKLPFLFSFYHSFQFSSFTFVFCKNIYSSSNKISAKKNNTVTSFPVYVMKLFTPIIVMCARKKDKGSISKQSEYGLHDPEKRQFFPITPKKHCRWTITYGFSNHHLHSGSNYFWIELELSSCLGPLLWVATTSRIYIFIYIYLSLSLSLSLSLYIHIYIYTYNTTNVNVYINKHSQ